MVDQLKGFLFLSDLPYSYISSVILILQKNVSPFIAVVPVSLRDYSDSGGYDLTYKGQEIFQKIHTFDYGEE